MIYFKKIVQIIFLFFLGLALFSCEEGCVEYDEFSTRSIEVNSNPNSYRPNPDPVYGTYNSDNGGQSAEWHDTGYVSNGEHFVVQISGSWTAQEGIGMNESLLNAMPLCKICSIKNSSPNQTSNCICHPGEQPIPEILPNGSPATSSCASSANQNNPALCSCTTTYPGKVTDYDVYHFPSDYLKKDYTKKENSKQQNCRFQRGMGAYVGLYGKSGVEIPNRAYHLFTVDSICNIVRNSNGQCIDKQGNDATKYVFTSLENKIFVKDDKQGNNPATTSYISGSTPHESGEKVKVIIYDSYYKDNYGKYNLTFYKGVASASGEDGIFETLIKYVEEKVMGKISASGGAREGGILEFMFNSLVKDARFIRFVNLSLVLYLIFFGIGSLIGVVEMTRKEIASRILKFALVIFFTNQNSWYFFNKIVVGFFKDGMDSVVKIIMNLYDSRIEPTSAVILAQVDRATDLSKATRFSYIDNMIKDLLSVAVSKKVLGLFFVDIFGFIYILCIYALIFFFIYVMAVAAINYLVNFMKIIFVLSLGPLFIVLSLFSKTSDIFKNWVSFLGSRALEIIFLFAVLYPFLTIINKYFTDMFYYRACGVNKGIGVVKMIVYYAEVNRSLPEWFMSFFMIAGLLAITLLIIQKMPEVSGYLISISGVPNKDVGNTGRGQSGTNMASAMLNNAIAKTFSALKSDFVAGNIARAMRFSASGLTSVARSSGVADIFNRIPGIGPRTTARNAYIDGAINRAIKQGGSHDDIRRVAMQELGMLMNSNKNLAAALGIDMKAIAGRLDQKLVKDPLQNFIKSEAQRLKKDGSGGGQLFGKDLRDKIKENAREWARNNLGSGAQRAEDYLKQSSMKDLVRSKAEYSSSEAARAFAGDNKAKENFMMNLQQESSRNARKYDERSAQNANKWHRGFPDLVKNALNKAKDNIRGKESIDKKAENFLRKVDKIENPLYKGLNPVNPSNWFKSGQDGTDGNPFNRRNWNFESKDYKKESLEMQRRAISKVLLDTDKGISKLDRSQDYKSQKKQGKEIYNRNYLYGRLHDLARKEAENDLKKEKKDFYSMAPNYIPSSSKIKDAVDRTGYSARKMLSQQGLVSGPSPDNVKFFDPKFEQKRDLAIQSLKADDKITSNLEKAVKIQHALEGLGIKTENQAEVLSRMIKDQVLEDKKSGNLDQYKDQTPTILSTSLDPRVLSRYENYLQSISQGGDLVSSGSASDIASRSSTSDTANRDNTVGNVIDREINKSLNIFNREEESINKISRNLVSDEREIKEALGKISSNNQFDQKQLEVDQVPKSNLTKKPLKGILKKPKIPEPAEDSGSIMVGGSNFGFIGNDEIENYSPNSSARHLLQNNNQDQKQQLQSSDYSSNLSLITSKSEKSELLNKDPDSIVIGGSNFGSIENDKIRNDSSNFSTKQFVKDDGEDDYLNRQDKKQQEKSLEYLSKEPLSTVVSKNTVVDNFESKSISSFNSENIVVDKSSDISDKYDSINKKLDQKSFEAKESSELIGIEKDSFVKQLSRESDNNQNQKSQLPDYQFKRLSTVDDKNEEIEIKSAKISSDLGKVSEKTSSNLKESEKEILLSSKEDLRYTAERKISSQEDYNQAKIERDELVKSVALLDSFTQAPKDLLLQGGIENILVQAPKDLLLQGSLPLLDKDSASKGDLDPKVAEEIKKEKTKTEIDLKISKIDNKMTNYELQILKEQLAKGEEVDTSKIQALEQKTKDLKIKIDKKKSEIENFNNFLSGKK